MKLTDIIDEMQAVNKKTGKDITKHLIAYLEKKISKEEFEKLREQIIKEMYTK